jgi:hypothetical protein
MMRLKLNGRQRQDVPLSGGVTAPKTSIFNGSALRVAYTRVYLMRDIKSFADEIDPFCLLRNFRKT